MTTITVRSNANTIRLGIRRYAEKLEPAVDETMQEGLEEAAKEAAGGYPDGTYAGYRVPYRGEYRKRTGVLGDSTTWRRSGSSYSLMASAYRGGRQYNTYVTGDSLGQGQAWMHAGRWPIAYRVMEKWVDKITKRIGDAIDALSTTSIPSSGSVD